MALEEYVFDYGFEALGCAALGEDGEGGVLGEHEVPELGWEVRGHCEGSVLRWWEILFCLMSWGDGRSFCVCRP